jgi:uncharacterized protein GlcG (DUF336 family)
MSDKKMTGAIVLVLLACVSPSRGQEPRNAVQVETITIRSLTLEYQLKAANAAIGRCKAEGHPAAVVLVDDKGNVRLQMAGDHARSSDLEEARRKARTSALMHRSTASLRKDAELAGLHTPPDPDFLIAPGGFPLSVSSQFAGAIGVADGSTSEVLDRCAEEAALVLNAATAGSEHGTSAERH